MWALLVQDVLVGSLVAFPTRRIGRLSWRHASPHTRDSEEPGPVINKRTLYLAIVFAVVLAVFAASSLMAPKRTVPSSVRVVLASDIEWGHLNPLRGDASPRAGTLWGDRGAPVPCGFLVEFVDGFSSPPHIHPVTYRGVVISGVVHNDVPTAEEVWLPAGSFWTQPAGEVHITAAKGSNNIAYIEIEKGPYLVHPSEDAFERAEVPVKLDVANMPWTDAPGSAPGAKVAALAGNPNDEHLRRSLIKLPAGFEGSVRSQGSTLHVVLIQGRTTHEVTEKSDRQTLESGSYFGSEGEVAHRLSCDAGADCLLYVRTMGAFDVVPASGK